MTNGKLPAIQFYLGDWMKDPAVRASSLAARGLWIELIFAMHDSPRRGFLELKSDKPLSNEQIARKVGASVKDCKVLLEELDDLGVYSVTENGVIFNRRMVRDEAKRGKLSEAGKRGGRMRVANEREARRSEDPQSPEIQGMAKDEKVMEVWKCIPTDRRRNRPITLLAISDALERCMDSKAMESRSKASTWLSKRISLYFGSPEGQGRFHRSAIRWLDEDGYFEEAEAWEGRDNANSSF